MTKKKEEKTAKTKVKETATTKKEKNKAEPKNTAQKKRITYEYNKLVKLFTSKASEKKHVIQKLSKRAAFLLVLSEEMEKNIQSSDMTVETINASQSFIKANPLLKDYRDTIKSYQTVIKQLCDLVKNEPASEKDELDELEKFLSS